MQPKRQMVDHTALDAFIARLAEIDDMLERLQRLSEDHFNTESEHIICGDVGSLEHYAELLKRITNAAFSERC